MPPSYDTSREPDDSDSDSEERRPMEDKQRLIRMLSTEVAITTKTAWRGYGISLRVRKLEFVTPARDHIDCNVASRCL